MCERYDLHEALRFRQDPGDMRLPNRRLILLALFVASPVIAPEAVAHASPACGPEAPIDALERDGDRSRARLASTLLRGRTPALTAAERAARCRATPTVRVVRRSPATAGSCGFAVLAARAELSGCSVTSTPQAELMFVATIDARGRLATRPMSADDPRLEAPRWTATSTFLATCAAYESDASTSAPAVAAVRNEAVAFASCTATGMSVTRIREEVASCLENHRAGDALVTFNSTSGNETCRVLVRTERIAGVPTTRVSSRSADAAFSHAFVGASGSVCESFGAVDPAGCGRGAPLRRASDAACSIATADARALASSPAFACPSEDELRRVHVTLVAAARTATTFSVAPVGGVLARGISDVSDADVNAFIADAALRSSSCADRGDAPANRHRSDLLITFTVGTDGVGAITSSALPFDQGIARCVAEAVRASQATLRTTSEGATPIYQYTLAVLRP